MPVFSLSAHPAHPPRSVRAVIVHLTRTATGLRLRYAVEGGALSLPGPAAPVRTDQLWRTTCFELFVADGEGRYREFNLSPSTAWAAYAFDGYRAGMRAAAAQVAIACRQQEDCLFLDVDLIAEMQDGAALALTAVIEEAGGHKSYWSLAHGGAAPDFHDAACFAARVPAAVAP